MKRVKCIVAALLELLVILAGCGKAAIPATETTAGVEEQKSSSEEVTEAAQESTAEAESREETSAAETTEETTEGSTAAEERNIVIPELTIQEKEVPDTEAMRFVRALGVGFNAGNTFDAYIDGQKLEDDTVTETAWIPEKLTKETIQAYHEAGFTSVRIPVSWHNHVSEDYTISEAWLNRVQEAVDWAIDDGMYVILNIHHDNHPEANAFYPDSAHLEQSKNYVKAIWEQLAARFGGYDEHLIFEGLNEPRLVGTDVEWSVRKGDAASEDAVACINELNQLFVDTVRASGGNNETRYLMVPGYAASPDGVLTSGFSIPEDPADPTGEQHRIILEVHAYTPYDFALKPGGGSLFQVKLEVCTRDINAFMDRLYKTYVSKGVPVVIDEFGAVSRLNKEGELNVQDRVEYSAYYTAYARAHGMSCFVWDNGAAEGDGELFGLYSRSGKYFIFPEIVEALVKYGK